MKRMVSILIALAVVGLSVPSFADTNAVKDSQGGLKGCGDVSAASQRQCEDRNDKREVLSVCSYRRLYEGQFLYGKSKL